MYCFLSSSFVGVRKAKKEKLSLFSSFHTDTEETAGLRTSRSRKEHDSREKRDQHEEEEVMQVEDEGQLQDRPEDYGLKASYYSDVYGLNFFLISGGFT